VFFNGSGIPIGFKVEDDIGSYKGGQDGPPGSGSGKPGGSSDKDLDNHQQEERMRGNDKFKRFRNISRDMDANQDDSMEDCLGEETLGESHDLGKGVLVTPIAAFHPEVGHMIVDTSSTSLIHEVLNRSLEKDGQMGSKTPMEGAADKMGVKTNIIKEVEMTRNDDQYIVHGADGPFLMDRNKWPKLILSTEHDSQEQQWPGELTQEDNVINEKDIQGSANAGFSTHDNKSMKEGSHKNTLQLDEEDFMDYLSDQSKKSDMENVCQGW
jgi:hypothetical protein